MFDGNRDRIDTEYQVFHRSGADKIDGLEVLNCVIQHRGERSRLHDVSQCIDARVCRIESGNSESSTIRNMDSFDRRYVLRRDLRPQTHTLEYPPRPVGQRQCAALLVWRYRWLPFLGLYNRYPKATTPERASEAHAHESTTYDHYVVIILHADLLPLVVSVQTRL